MNDEEKYRETFEERRDEQIPYISDDARVSLEILKLHVKEDEEDFIYVEMEVEKDGKKKKAFVRKRRYIPLLTGDLAVANLDSIDKAVTSAQNSLCDRIRAYESKYGIDMENFRNRIARRHNYIVTQSRASGFGAQTAKTFNIQQRMDKRQTFVEGVPEKKGGVRGLLPHL